jgi:hypothetical protein
MGAWFQVHIQTCPKPHPISCTMGIGSFHEMNQQWRWPTTTPPPPNVGPKLKKEYSYTCVPLLGLCSLWQGELYLYHHQSMLVSRSHTFFYLHSRCAMKLWKREVYHFFMIFKFFLHFKSRCTPVLSHRVAWAINTRPNTNAVSKAPQIWRQYRCHIRTVHLDIIEVFYSPTDGQMNCLNPLAHYFV